MIMRLHYHVLQELIEADRKLAVVVNILRIIDVIAGPFSAQLEEIIAGDKRTGGFKKIRTQPFEICPVSLDSRSDGVGAFADGARFFVFGH